MGERPVTMTMTLTKTKKCQPDYMGERPVRHHSSPGPFPTEPSSACGSSDAMGAAKFSWDYHCFHKVAAVFMQDL